MITDTDNKEAVEGGVMTYLFLYHMHPSTELHLSNLLHEVGMPPWFKGVHLVTPGGSSAIRSGSLVKKNLP